MIARETAIACYDLCSWCDGDDGCGWRCLNCNGWGMVEVYGEPEDDDDNQPPASTGER